jgi:hypothetical protein
MAKIQTSPATSVARPVAAASDRAVKPRSMSDPATQLESDIVVTRKAKSAEKARPRKRSSVWKWSRVVEKTQQMEPPA